jgi:hypothetical protein
VSRRREAGDGSRSGERKAAHSGRVWWRAAV